jgi:hypothetical protein
MAGSSQTTRARGKHAQSRSTQLPSELGILSEDALQDKVLEQEREIEQVGSTQPLQRLHAWPYLTRHICSFELRSCLWRGNS